MQRIVQASLFGLLLATGTGCHILPLRAHTDAFYDLALKQNPGNAGAAFAQAQVLAQQGRYAEALNYYEKLKHLAPERPATWLGLGRAYYETYQFKQAEQAFAQAEKLNPSQEAELGLASTAMMQGRLGEASEKARQLEAKYGQSASVDRLAGDIAFMNGDMPAALARYQASLQAAPGQTGLQERIGIIEIFLGERTTKP